MNKTEILQHQIVSTSLWKKWNNIYALYLLAKKQYRIMSLQGSAIQLSYNRCHNSQRSKIDQIRSILTPFTNQQQIVQHIKMMQKMNQNQFQSQYIEMLDLLEKDIEIGIIRDFCRKQFQWSQAKINKFIHNQQINNINKFLHYRGFNQLEMVKIRSIWQFLDTYLQNKYDE